MADEDLDNEKVAEILKEIGRAVEVMADKHNAAGNEQEFDEALKKFVEEVFNIEIPRDEGESTEF